MKNIMFIFTVLFSVLGQASLAPYQDSLKQIETVLNSAELAKGLSGAVTVVRSLGDLVFEVNTSMCTSKVILGIVDYGQEPIKPGPTEYFVRSVDRIYCE